MKKGINVRVNFWATKCGYKWNNNKMRILNNKILKVEDELQKLRNWLFDNFTDAPKKRKKITAKALRKKSYKWKKPSQKTGAKK